MSTRMILISGFALALSGCATAPQTPERPFVVQLALSGSQGPCDWSTRQEPHLHAERVTLASIRWPRLVPRPRGQKGPSTQTLLAYGSRSHTTWTETERNFCLTLHKRPSVFVEGVPPIAMVEIAPDGPNALVSAQTTDPSLKRLVLEISPASGPAQTLDLDLSQGRTEAPLFSPAAGEWTNFILAAVHQGGEAQAPRALDLLRQNPSIGRTVIIQGRDLALIND